MVKFSKMLLNGGGGKLAGSMQMDRRVMVIKNCSQGVVCPCPGAIYHDIQTSSSLKLLGQSKPNIKWSIVRKGE